VGFFSTTFISPDIPHHLFWKFHGKWMHSKYRLILIFGSWDIHVHIPLLQAKWYLLVIFIVCKQTKMTHRASNQHHNHHNVVFYSQTINIIISSLQ
jgi:hypothetical protein